WVGLIGPNALQWPVAALAVLKSGAVLVPLNPRFKAAEVRKTAEDAELSAVIAAAGHRVIVGDAVGPRVSIVGFDAVDAEQLGGSDGFRVEPASGEPIAVIFTSGTNGLSKGGILTNRTLLD